MGMGGLSIACCFCQSPVVGEFAYKSRRTSTTPRYSPSVRRSPAIIIEKKDTQKPFGIFTSSSSSSSSSSYWWCWCHLFVEFIDWNSIFESQPIDISEIRFEIITKTQKKKKKKKKIGFYGWCHYRRWGHRRRRRQRQLRWPRCPRRRWLRRRQRRPIRRRRRFRPLCSTAVSVAWRIICWPDSITSIPSSSMNTCPVGEDRLVPIV